MSFAGLNMMSLSANSFLPSRAAGHEGQRLKSIPAQIRQLILYIKFSIDNFSRIGKLIFGIGRQGMKDNVKTIEYLAHATKKRAGGRGGGRGAGFPRTYNHRTYPVDWLTLDSNPYILY